MRHTSIILVVILYCSCARQATQIQATEDTHTSTLRSELQRMFGRVEILDTIKPLIIDSAGEKRHAKQATTRHTEININLTNQKSDTIEKNTSKVYETIVVQEKNAKKHLFLNFLPTFLWLILLLILLLWRFKKK